MSFQFYKQLNAMDCGPTCLRMIAKHYGKHYNTESIRQKAGLSKQGVSLLGISETAEKLGFRTRGVQIDYSRLQQAPVPAILHWNQNHFVILIDIDKNGVKIADPSKGLITYKRSDFLNKWGSNKRQDQEKTGTALLLEPTPAFYDATDEKENALSWNIITKYLKGSRWQLTQIFISLLVGLMIQLIMPYLTQGVVDNGINAGNLDFITLILIAQLMLTVSTTVVNFIRSRLQLKISSTVNISILSDFWIKLTRLPLSYYDARHTGDTLQRISDNGKIQTFLTGQTLNTIFSFFSFAIYAVILMRYSISLFVIFMAGNLLYLGWIQFFFRFRRRINSEVFALSAREKAATLELIQGMQEIRLNNAEKSKRWGWEDIQAQLVKLNFKSLDYDQWQSAGALLITQGKDILISYLVAKLVIDGQLTFGMMLAVQYIIGSLSGPVQQLIGLAQSFQDAKISMERLNEIHALADEEPAGGTFNTRLPESRSLKISQLSFAYPGLGNSPVLKNLNLTIPEGKVTAIVGVSGSGKTTFLKLLLKVYDQYNGEIRIGESDLRTMSHRFWRENCGAVLQDGFVFNDTIAQNIAVGEEYVDYDKLVQSCRIACILDFVEGLPNGFNSRLGADGLGVSQGQRQRLLIARAVYKNPEYLMFDEATNALDANNERAIVENLAAFFKGRTVIVVAHRLSTVKNADKIVVLHEGQIAEEGTHEELSHKRGRYYELVKNQLELGE